MSTATLHYIYDPLCGWCYGSAPLVKAAREIGGLQFVLHGGGMMAGSARQLASEGLREFIMPHVARITGMTGQPFAEAYTNGLLRDPTAMLDSEPPTAAILAVEAAAGRGADMLAHMQKAHYIEGRALSDRAPSKTPRRRPRDRCRRPRRVRRAPHGRTAHALRCSAPSAYARACPRRRLLSRVGGQGFPTFALETPRGLAMLDSARWLGKPAEWRATVEAALAA